MKKMKNKLAIFDLDGTLFNTNDVNYNSYNEALKEIGCSIDYDYFCNYCNGRKYTEFLPNIINDEKTIYQVHKRKKELYSKYVDKAIKNSHLFEIIRDLKHEYNIVIVTTASRKNTMDLLLAFKVENLFDLIITQEDVKEPKPNPEGFNLAIKKFNVSSSQTIIFEDSDEGIKAAKKTNAAVFKIEQF